MFPFLRIDSGDIILATCAQDFSIRIWRISPRDPEAVTSTIKVDDLHPNEDIKMKENTFSFKVNSEYSLETLKSQHISVES